MLISADALWENGFGVIFPELEGDSGFAEERAVLELISTLDVGRDSRPRRAVHEVRARSTSLRRGSIICTPIPHATRRTRSRCLLKFLLLERQRMPLAEVPRLLAQIRLFGEANRRYLQQTEAELAQWAVAQLVRAGAAAVDGELLLNRD